MPRACRQKRVDYTCKNDVDVSFLNAEDISAPMKENYQGPREQRSKTSTLSSPGRRKLHSSPRKPSQRKPAATAAAPVSSLGSSALSSLGTLGAAATASKPQAQTQTQKRSVPETAAKGTQRTARRSKAKRKAPEQSKAAKQGGGKRVKRQRPKRGRSAQRDQEVEEDKDQGGKAQDQEPEDMDLFEDETPAGPQAAPAPAPATRRGRSGSRGSRKAKPQPTVDIAAAPPGPQLRVNLPPAVEDAKQLMKELAQSRRLQKKIDAKDRAYATLFGKYQTLIEDYKEQSSAKRQEGVTRLEELRKDLLGAADMWKSKFSKSQAQMQELKQQLKQAQRSAASASAKRKAEVPEYSAAELKEMKRTNEFLREETKALTEKVMILERRLRESPDPRPSLPAQGLQHRLAVMEVLAGMQTSEMEGKVTCRCVNPSDQRAVEFDLTISDDGVAYNPQRVHLPGVQYPEYLQDSIEFDVGEGPRFLKHILNFVFSQETSS